MTSNGILPYSWVSVLSSHQTELPPAADRNKYRDPQPDTRRKVKYLGTGILPSFTLGGFCEIPSGLREPVHVDTEGV